MKNRILFFATIFSIILITGLTSCGSESSSSIVQDLQVKNQALTDANNNKEMLINGQQKKIEELEKKIESPVKISTENFSYYKFSGTAGELGKKFYKIISLIIISDPVITEGVEGDNGGQTIEFILESIEPQPIRVIGSETYYYDEKGSSTIPSKIKIGNQVVLDDFYEGQEGR